MNTLPKHPGSVAVAKLHVRANLRPLRLFLMAGSVLTACFVNGDQANSREFPMFGELPKLTEHWTLSERGTNGSSSFGRSWVILTNAQSGDLLSFEAQQMGSKPFPEVSLGPWSDAAGEIFPDGYPWKWEKVASGDLTVQFIRNNVVELSTVDAAKRNVVQKALEYTLVFEHKSGTNLLAHGYALALGKQRVFVQHTSARAITPDLAHEMASGLIWIHRQQEASRNRVERKAPEQPERSAEPQSTEAADGRCS